MFKKSFPIIRQKEQADCGLTCLQMVSKYYGQFHSLQQLRRQVYFHRQGVSLKGLSDLAEAIGFQTLGAKLTWDGTEEESGLRDIHLPCVLLWNQHHYVILYKINKRYAWIADPARGKMRLSRKEFLSEWVIKEDKGIVLLLTPTPRFYETENEEIDRTGFGYVFRYLIPYRGLFGQVGLGLIVRIAFSVLFPFLTQSVVDIGIANQDLSFIFLILVAQIMLFVSSTMVSILRTWIFLHVGTRVSFALIYDFLTKLVKLPLSFFYRKTSGEILQRIQEHERINAFLSSTTVDIVFSMFNLVIFSFILFYYSATIFFVFWGASILYLVWILIFLKRRRKIDYESFQYQANNQTKLIEIIDGIQELKLQNSERKRLWEWATLQGQIFKVNIKNLIVNQMQGQGAGFINQLKNIFITFLAAKAVVDGNMTLGMMLSTQYIIGQIDGPLNSMIGFVQSYQDAKMSLERVGRINEEPEEEEDHENKVAVLPAGDIEIESLFFRYHNEQAYILKDINITIPRNKITAIVGHSGSGKTTLLKLILGFFKANEGKIRIGNTDLHQIRNSTWRETCGVVMQESYLFSDSIANNVIEGEEKVNIEQLHRALDFVNLTEFINSLPNGINTDAGARGVFMSQGQKQRILLARAIYKNPNFIFLDEATNSLDAYNEKVIMENLTKFYTGRTVMIVAHRLSTVKDADQIIVLKNGEIVEVGTHDILVQQRGHYYTLVNNQLTLEI